MPSSPRARLAALLAGACAGFAACSLGLEEADIRETAGATTGGGGPGGGSSDGGAGGGGAAGGGGPTGTTTGAGGGAGGGGGCWADDPTVTASWTIAGVPLAALAGDAPSSLR